MFKFTTIGHDLEVIVTDTNESPVSMVDTRRTTLESCVIYPDNVLLELNTDPVSLDDFEAAIKTNVKHVNKYLEEHSLVPRWGMSSAKYPKNQLCNKEAHRIGCLPFSSAYLLGVNLKPFQYQDEWRYAGGHIHLGFDKNLVPSHWIVQQLDELLKDKQKPDSRRDAFYGQRGAYREKSYGLEYRSLDNSWVHNPQIILDALREVERRANKLLGAN